MPQSDITKQAWKFQEGLTFLALQKILHGRKKVWWNYQNDLTPSGMSIDPDLLYGSNPQNPEAVIFVTHASAERAGEKKFWRTVAEVIEIKKLESHPKVLSILFSGNIKANLMKAYKQLFDGVYHLDETSDGKAISREIIELTIKHGNKNPEVCLSILTNEFIDSTLYWNPFLNKIKQLAASSFGARHNQMMLISHFKKSRIPKARKTVFRRSTCKMFTLPPDMRELLINDKQIKSIPYHTELLGWFIKNINGYKLVDEELIELIKNCDKKSIDVVMSEASKLSTFCIYVNNLWNIEIRKFCNDWILNNFDDLCSNKGMLKNLKLIFDEPYAPFRDQISEEKCPKTHWLFESLMFLLRAETGRKDGYGYSSLARETGIPRVDLSMTELVNRKKINDIELDKVAKVFSNNLNKIGIHQSSKFMEQSIIVGCESIFHYNIATYRHFNPIEWLVCNKLNENNFKYEYPKLHPSFLSENALGITTTTGNIINIADDIWIKCQSAYDGKNDKRKELCGRVGAMKLVYGPEELRNKRFYLVIDGFFNDRDLALLEIAGWDGIYYYDELDLLMKEIKKDG